MSVDGLPPQDNADKSLGEIVSDVSEKASASLPTLSGDSPGGGALELAVASCSVVGWSSAISPSGDPP